jgi:hypothetical protein
VLTLFGDVIAELHDDLVLAELVVRRALAVFLGLHFFLLFLLFIISITGMRGGGASGSGSVLDQNRDDHAGGGSAFAHLAVEVESGRGVDFVHFLCDVIEIVERRRFLIDDRETRHGDLALVLLVQLF